jgi:hypothetical protein
MSEPEPRDMNSKLPNIMMVPRRSGQNLSAIRAFPNRERTVTRRRPLPGAPTVGV